MSSNPEKPAKRQHVYDFEKLQKDFVHAETSTSYGSSVTGERMHVGLVHKARGTGSKPHSHPNEQFNFVLRGTLKAYIGGEEYLVPKGCVIHIPANTVHSIVATPEEDVIFFVCKDTRHTLGNVIPADGKYDGPRYEPGFGPKAKNA